MAEARTQILAHLPRSGIGQTLPVPEREPETAADRDALVRQFVATATANGIVCERTAGAGASRLSIMAGLRQAAVPQVYASHAIDEVVPGLLDALAVLGIDVVLLATEAQRVADAAAQAKPVDIGLTVAAAAWADSGTVVLRFPHPRDALAYVWPPRTVILLPVATLFMSQRGWMNHLRQADRLMSTLDADLSFVSEPTSTRDVTSNRVVGVYGATDIRVIIIEPEPSL